MKRIALLAALAVVAATPAFASAAPAKASKRTITKQYQGFVGASAAGASTALTACPANDACWDFETQKGEKTVVLTSKDASGAPAAFQAYVDDDYEGSVQSFCGTGTLTVSPKKAALISIRVAPLAGCQGVPTEGVLTAVLANR